MKLYGFMIFILNLILTSNLSANNKKYDPSPFDVVPLNLPVEEDEVRFLIKTPLDFTIDKFFYLVIGPKLFNIKLGHPKEIKLVAGPQGLELKISTKGLKNGFYRLYVKVIDKKKITHNYKSVYRDYLSFVISLPSNLVPQPDAKKNDSTLLGIDVDGNGIRDDVQNYILKTYQGNTELIQAMNQYAMGFQNTLLNKDNKEMSIQATHEKLKGLECIHYVLVGQGMHIAKAIKESKKLKAIYINTKLRIDASEKVSEHFHGQSGGSSNKEEACLF